MMQPRFHELLVEHAWISLELVKTIGGKPTYPTQFCCYVNGAQPDHHADINLSQGEKKDFIRYIYIKHKYITMPVISRDSNESNK